MGWVIFLLIILCALSLAGCGGFAYVAYRYWWKITEQEDTIVTLSNEVKYWSEQYETLKKTSTSDSVKLNSLILDLEKKLGDKQTPPTV